LGNGSSLRSRTLLHGCTGELDAGLGGDKPVEAGRWFEVGGRRILGVQKKGGKGVGTPLLVLRKRSSAGKEMGRKKKRRRLKLKKQA